MGGWVGGWVGGVCVVRVFTCVCARSESVCGWLYLAQPETKLSELAA